MRIKLTIVIILLAKIALTQTEIDYFGQIPPSDSAIVLAPGLISLSGRYEEVFSFAPDGKEVTFAKSDRNWIDFTPYYSKYVDSVWLEPEVMPFAIPQCLEPGTSYSNDGNTIYFSSSRPTAVNSDNVMQLWNSLKSYKVERTTDGWGEPVEIPSDSIYPTANNSVSDTSNLYLARDGKIYVSEFLKGQHQSPVILKGGINNARGYSYATISHDESYLLLVGLSPGNKWNADIFISFRQEDNSWTAGFDLAHYINTIDRENIPSLSPDGKYMFFSRRDAKNRTFSDILWVDIEKVISNLLQFNLPPYINILIPDTLVYTNFLFNIKLTETTFSDINGIETLNITAKQKNGDELPNWLKFDTITNTFSGITSEVETIEIHVTATDNEEASVSDIFKLIVEENTGLKTNHIKDGLEIHPNPANNTIQIKYQGLSQKGEVYYKIIDLNGRFAQQGKSEGNIIDVSKLSKGKYLLSLKIDTKTCTKKIIIQ